MEIGKIAGRRRWKKVSFTFSGDGEDLNTEHENDSDSVVSGLSFGKFQGFSILEVEEKQRCKIYDKVLRSYEESQSRVERLEKAKENILRCRYGHTSGPFSNFILFNASSSQGMARGV